MHKIAVKRENGRKLGDQFLKTRTDFFENIGLGRTEIFWSRTKIFLTGELGYYKGKSEWIFK